MKQTLRNMTLLLAVVVGAMLTPLAALATPAGDLAALTGSLSAALERVAANDAAGASSAFAAFHDGWGPIEDGIRDLSPAYYGAIEGAMGDVTFALTANPFDSGKAKKALDRLDAVCESFIKGQPVPGNAAAHTPSGQVTMPSVAARLDTAIGLIDKGDVRGAVEQMAVFRTEWVIVEGIVAVKSQRVYESTENNMARAYGLLAQGTPDPVGARSIIVRIQSDLSPYSQGETRYGVFDAMVILLREGLEAILIVAALLAFLQRSGNGDKRTWVWLGGGAGILASVLAAFIIIIGVSKSGGGNSAIMQGATALFAAGMLLYMSFWLHSKSNLAAWHKYISGGASSAMKKGSLFGLALLAFLAVFREGIETVLFYVGMVSGISLGDFAIGVALGSTGVATIGVLIFIVGMRISVGPFFRVASILVYYLAFKFAGAGVHAFQLAGKVPVHVSDYLPTNGLLGLYPTWETTGAQLAFVAVAAGLLLYGHFHQAPRPAAPAARPAAKSAGQTGH